MRQLKIFATIASIFSVFFSLSIIKEIEKFTEPMVLVIITIFLSFILITNEYFKVKELAKKFQGISANKFILGFTFILSFALSGLGFYFWFNKADEIEIKSDSQLGQNRIQIERFYQNKIDSVYNLKNNETEYLELISSIDYWKNRTCYNSEERKVARENVKDLELKRATLNGIFQAVKNDKIKSLENLKSRELDQVNQKMNENQYIVNKTNILFYILFILVAITEVVIIYIQYLIANFFTPEQRRNLKILQNLISKHDEKIELDHVKYNAFILKNSDKDVVWNYAKNLYFLFGDLKIIDHEGCFLDKNSAYKRLINYYEKMNDNI